MTGQLTLYEKQKIIVDDYPGKHAIFSDPGTGKTAMSISIAKKLNKTFLVVCPKSLPENWRREIEMWWPEADKVGYKIVSKENFKKYHSELVYPITIIDESHLAFHNYQSQLYKVMEKHVKVNKINDLILLTGTPMTATYWSVWSAARLMGKNWSYISFRKRYFQQIKMGYRYVWIMRKDEKTRQEMAELIKKIGYTLSLSDFQEIPEQNYIYEYFDLTPDQRKQYILCSDPNPALMHLRKHQVEAGSVKTNGYKDDIIIKNDKETRIIELCGQHPKIIIVANFNLQLELYKKFLEKSFPNRPIDIVNGEVSGDDRQRIFDLHNNAQENILLINSKICEGYNLPMIPTMVFASMSYAYKDYKQMHARIQRGNNLKVNTYIYLITRKHPILGESTDWKINEAMKLGVDFNDMVYV